MVVIAAVLQPSFSMREEMRSIDSGIAAAMVEAGGVARRMLWIIIIEQKAGRRVAVVAGENHPCNDSLVEVVAVGEQAALLLSSSSSSSRSKDRIIKLVKCPGGLDRVVVKRCIGAG